MPTGKGRDIDMEEAVRAGRGEVPPRTNPFPSPAWDPQLSRVDDWSLRVGKSGLGKRQLGSPWCPGCVRTQEQGGVGTRGTWGQPLGWQRGQVYRYQDREAGNQGHA